MTKKVISPFRKNKNKGSAQDTFQVSQESIETDATERDDRETISNVSDKRKSSRRLRNLSPFHSKERSRSPFIKRKSSNKTPIRESDTGTARPDENTCAVKYAPPQDYSIQNKDPPPSTATVDLAQPSAAAQNELDNLRKEVKYMKMERERMDLEKKAMEHRLQDKIDYLTRQVEYKDKKLKSMSVAYDHSEEHDPIALERKAMEEQLLLSEKKAVEDRLGNVTRELEEQKAIGLEQKVIEDRLEKVTNELEEARLDAISRKEMEVMERKAMEERLEKANKEAEEARKIAKTKEEKMQDVIDNLTREIKSKEKRVLSRSVAFEKKLVEIDVERKAMALTRKDLEDRLEKVTNELEEARRIANRRLSLHHRVTSAQVAKL